MPRIPRRNPAVHGPAHVGRLLWGIVALLSGSALTNACNDSGTGMSAGLSLTLDSSSVTIAAGESGSVAVTIDRTELSGEVGLSVRGVPSGVTATFDPSVTTGTTSMLLLSVANATTPGKYQLFVKGRSEAGSSERALGLTITPPPPSLSLSLADHNLTVGQGASAGTGVGITRTNFAGTVRLSLVGAPAGVTWTFTPETTDGDTSTLTVQVGSEVLPGVYRLEARGANSQATGVVTLILTVSASNPSFAVTLGSSSVSVSAGRTVNVPVTITRAPGYTDSVTLHVLQAPSMLTWSFNPPVATGNGSTLTLGVRSGLPARLSLGATVTVIGTSPAGSSTATIRVLIRGGFLPGQVPP